MAFTQTDLDELDEIIKAGVLEEQHGDKKVKFAPIEDLKLRINHVERKLNGTGSNRRPNGGVVVFRR